MIEDKELRDLFQAESEEHLQNLDNGLLNLENDPHNQPLLDEVFREAHSLKGAARMLGIIEVETIAHRLEDMLGKAKSGKIKLTSDLIDKIYYGLDCIRKFVNEAVNDEPAELDVDEVIARLEEDGALEQSAPKEDKKTEEKKAVESASEPVQKESEMVAKIEEKEVQKVDVGQESESLKEEAIKKEEMEEQQEKINQIDETLKGYTKKYRIETIRVEPQKLDALMTQSGELTVTKIRISRRLSEIEELVSNWEEWSREIFSMRMLIRELENSSLNGNGDKFISFLNEEISRVEELGNMLKRIETAASEDNSRLDLIANNLEEGIRSVRLLPLSTIFNLFPRMVRDLSRQQGKEVRLLMEGEDTSADKHILEEMKDPLMHMIRNAIDHGIETPEEREKLGKPHLATIWLRAYQTATNIVIEVIDDGRGIGLENVKEKAIAKGICSREDFTHMSDEQIRSLIFSSGFSTSSYVTDVSGRGVGLDVVRANIERLKGTITVDSTPEIGTTFRVYLPITLATTRVLIVKLGSRVYAIPVEFVETSILVNDEDIFYIEGKETINLEGSPVSVAHLSELLEMEHGENRKEEDKKRLSCIIISIGEEKLGVIVDALIDEQEVVLKPLGGVLKRVRNVSGATILGTGELCIILNPVDLIKSVRKRTITSSIKQSVQERTQRETILLVEDSITTRTQERRILESAGYDVITAVDGADAYSKLTSQNFDAVVSDIQMPNMDGFVLTERIRTDKQYSDLPVILVTSLSSEEDRRRGLEVGANAYITKGTFDQKVLLDTLDRLV
jgi:two-component system chemotaxis sensor kinase CheA